MKIGILGENYYPTLGGIQEHIHHLAKGLMARGHEARVLTGMPDVETWYGPPDEPWVLRVGKARKYTMMGTTSTLTLGPGVARELRRTIKREKFDLIHVHAPVAFGLPLMLYGVYRGPLVATLHSPMNGDTLGRRLAQPYYRWALRRHRKVISVSTAATEALRRYAPFEPVVVPNGVDVDAMASGTPREDLCTGEFRNILMLGRLEARNGPDIMFDALPRILEEHPDVRLIVAGEERPSGTAVHEAMVPESVRDRVVFLGSVFDDRADVYASADLCVIPARAGTFSIIILEALAAGAPVVATPFITAHEGEDHWKPVHVTREISVDALVETMNKALGESPADREARIASGCEIVRRFDWDNVVGRIIEVYESVLSG